MNGNTLLAAWRNFKATLPAHLADAPLIKCAFVSGAAWAADRLTNYRNDIVKEAGQMLDDTRKVES